MPATRTASSRSDTGDSFGTSTSRSGVTTSGCRASGAAATVDEAASPGLPGSAHAAATAGDAALDVAGLRDLGTEKCEQALAVGLAVHEREVLGCGLRDQRGDGLHGAVVREHERAVAKRMCFRDREPADRRLANVRNDEL